jgi:hypothetical protein
MVVTEIIGFFLRKIILYPMSISKKQFFCKLWIAGLACSGLASLSSRWSVANVLFYSQSYLL